MTPVGAGAMGIGLDSVLFLTSQPSPVQPAGIAPTVEELKSAVKIPAVPAVAESKGSGTKSAVMATSPTRPLGGRVECKFLAPATSMKR